MRKEAASLIALAALSLAEELTTNDVPLACANICGPIVELSALCDIDGSTRQLELKKRKLSRRDDVAQDPKAKEKRQLLPETVTIEQPRPGVIGQFKTITNGITPTGVPPFNRPPVTQPVAAPPVAAPPVAAPPVQQQPASPNGEAVGDAAQPVTQTFNLRPTTTPTFINPLFPSLVPPQTQPAQPVVETPPTTSTVLPVASSIPGGIGNLPVGNGGGQVSPSRGVVDGGGGAEAGDGDDAAGNGDVADDVGDIKDDAGHLWPGQKQKQDEEDRELRCFCNNESFEVERVAALCASCIMQVGDDNTRELTPSPSRRTGTLTLVRSDERHHVAVQLHSRGV